MLNENIRGIPEYEWHWSAWSCIPFLDIVPRISIAVDSSGSVPVDLDSVAGDNESGMVVLEGNWVCVVSPIIKIIRQLNSSSQRRTMALRDCKDPYRPDTSPFNGNIGDNWI